MLQPGAGFDAIYTDAEFSHLTDSNIAVVSMTSAVGIRCAAILVYSDEISMPIKSRPLLTAILPVVPEPENGSITKSPGLLHERMWSSANLNGNLAGCGNR